MLKTALAELSRAESKSLGCGERVKHLRKAIQIDGRLRDYAISKYKSRPGRRPHELASQYEIRLIEKLNRAVPGAKRIVRSACRRGARRLRRNPWREE